MLMQDLYRLGQNLLKAWVVGCGGGLNKNLVKPWAKQL